VTVTPLPPGTDAHALAAATITALAVGDEVLAGVLVDGRNGVLVLEGHGASAAAVVVVLAERFGDLPGRPTVRSVWGPGADSAAVRARALSLIVLSTCSSGSSRRRSWRSPRRSRLAPPQRSPPRPRHE
jgi:hypothetical protein